MAVLVVPSARTGNELSEEPAVKREADPSSLALLGMTATRSLAHHLLRWRQRLDESRPREQALGVFHQRRGRLAQGDAVVIQAPQQRRDRHVEHGEFVSQ